jgi:hypothetical protein
VIHLNRVIHELSTIFLEARIRVLGIKLVGGDPVTASELSCSPYTVLQSISTRYST